MTASLSRSVSVYQCDVCNRRFRHPSNRKGIDIVQRCVVTNGCKGKMHRVMSQTEVNKTPVFAPNVAGLTNWVQRSVFYTHSQPIVSSIWVVNHNLSNKPNIYVYLSRVVDGKTTLVQTTDFQTTTVDGNTSIIEFDNVEQGLAQCVSSMSQNNVNPNTSTAAIRNDNIIQLTNNGTLTIATAVTAPKISFRMTYISPAYPDPVYIEYINVGVPSLQSPWAASTSEFVVVNGKQYMVRSLNIATTPLATSYFSTGVIVPGSTATVSSVISPKEIIILLSRAPHAAADRIYDQYIDAVNLTSLPAHLFYNDFELYADSTVLKNTYPPILVV